MASTMSATSAHPLWLDLRRGHEQELLAFRLQVKKVTADLERRFEQAKLEILTRHAEEEKKFWDEREDTAETSTQRSKANSLTTKARAKRKTPAPKTSQSVRSTPGSVTPTARPAQEQKRIEIIELSSDEDELVVKKVWPVVAKLKPVSASCNEHDMAKKRSNTFTPVLACSVPSATSEVSDSNLKDQRASYSIFTDRLPAPDDLGQQHQQSPNSKLTSNAPHDNCRAATSNDMACLDVPVGSTAVPQNQLGGVCSQRGIIDELFTQHRQPSKKNAEHSDLIAKRFDHFSHCPTLSSEGPSRRQATTGRAPVYLPEQVDGDVQIIDKRTQEPANTPRSLSPLALPLMQQSLSSVVSTPTKTTNPSTPARRTRRKSSILRSLNRMNVSLERTSEAKRQAAEDRRKSAQVHDQSYGGAQHTHLHSPLVSRSRLDGFEMPTSGIKLQFQPASSTHPRDVSRASRASSCTLDATPSQHGPTTPTHGFKRKIEIDLSNDEDSEYEPSDPDSARDAVANKTSSKPIAKKLKSTPQTQRQPLSSQPKRKNTFRFQVSTRAAKDIISPASRHASAPKSQYQHAYSDRVGPSTPTRRNAKLAAEKRISQLSTADQEFWTSETIAQAAEREQRAKSTMDNVNRRMRSMSITPTPSSVEQDRVRGLRAFDAWTRERMEGDRYLARKIQPSSEDWSESDMDISEYASVDGLIVHV